MKLVQFALTAFVLVASMGLSAPAQAELLDNNWYPFEFVLEQDPEHPCADDQYYLAQGMQHVNAASLRKGGVVFHFNALGTFTGLESGLEAHWRHNFTEVLPIQGETTVYSLQETLKIIGQGDVPSYFAKIKFHVTDIGGELRAYIDSGKIGCR